MKIRLLTCDLCCHSAEEDMNEVFYISAAIAIMSTVMVITRLHVVHALLYFIVSLLSVAVIFFVLGAPFIAALEVIIYAGAIMVLFVFVIMMLNLGPQSVKQEREWLKPGTWIGPGILSAVLITELIYLFVIHGNRSSGVIMITPKRLGVALFSQYALGVELASLLLMSGLIGAYHIGRRLRTGKGEQQ